MTDLDYLSHISLDHKFAKLKNVRQGILVLGNAAENATQEPFPQRGSGGVGGLDSNSFNNGTVNLELLYSP